MSTECIHPVRCRHGLHTFTESDAAGGTTARPGPGASVVHHLAGVSVRRPDPDETVLRFHDLWRAERDTPPPATDRLTVGALLGACLPDPDDTETVLRETGLDPDTEPSAVQRSSRS
ncbi:hypothetical protein ACWGR4_33340 [Embleya sp. NPDC055664]